MNRVLLQQYISEYVRNFERISKDEIYKWQAVQHFKVSWNIDAEDFGAMLEDSLKKTSNLMVAKNYFPERMIVENAERNPEIVRAAFIDLYDEERDLLERVKSFQTRITEVNTREFLHKKHYQDDRAVMVYLNLQYPNTYFFYKFGMFKTFAEKINYDYMPKHKALVNILPYLHLCEQVREELVLNNQLLKLHSDRIGKDEFFDESFNILTQDFIYAVTKYLVLDDNSLPDIKPRLTFAHMDAEPQREVKRFEGRHTNFESQHRRNKRLGDLGEDLVLQVERDKHGERVEHISKKVDGRGYDIKSFDDNGREKYIEVKTTKGGEDTPFYLSGVELERSKQEGDSYYLYRLFNFDEQKMAADYYVLHGDLSKYCVNPIQYKVVVKVNETGASGQT